MTANDERGAWLEREVHWRQLTAWLLEELGDHAVMTWVHGGSAKSDDDLASELGGWATALIEDCRPEIEARKAARAKKMHEQFIRAIRTQTPRMQEIHFGINPGLREEAEALWAADDRGHDA